MKYHRLACALPTLLLALPPALSAAPHILGRQEPPEAGVGTPLQARLAPQTGGVQTAVWSVSATLRLLFLRVDFPPDPAGNTVGAVNTTGTGEWSNCIDLCNGDPDYWITKNAQDLAAYYQEVSGGRLTLDITISPAVYRLPQPMADYGYPGSATQMENFFRDSLQAADADIDFTAYDAILVVHAGAGEETDIAWDSEGDLWSLYYPGLAIEIDGITVTEAIVMPQSGTQDLDDQGNLFVIDPLGVYAHEFGHWLGLPDLYSTAWIQTWKGVGRWGLMGDGLYNRQGTDTPMGSGPAHPEAWSKQDLGWVQVETVAPSPDPQSLFSLMPVQGSERVVQVSAGATTARYYLLENRQQTGFDQGLPGSGMLVWLIDPTVIDAQRAYNTVNTSVFQPGVKLIEADGDSALLSTYSSGDLGSGGDPFPGTSGTTLFTPYTNPSSNTFAQPGWFYLQDVAESGTAVQFTVGFAPGVPQGVTLAAANCAELQLSWQPVAAVDLDHYRIYRNDLLWQQTPELSVIIADASPAETYRVTAVDISGLESPRSPSVTASTALTCETTQVLLPGLGAGDDDRRSFLAESNCFLAMLAAGSPYRAELRHLRAFRDQRLMPTVVGRWLVRAYYAWLSPIIAAPLRRYGWLRDALRPLLPPLVALTRLLLPEKR